MLSFPKGTIVNVVVKSVKKMVPVFDIKGAVLFVSALRQGAGRGFQPVDVGPEDIAFLQ